MAAKTTLDEMTDDKQIYLSAELACRLAAIDIGSNSVRLLVAEALRGGAYRILDEEREPTRLGRSVSEKGQLADESGVQRSVAVATRGGGMWGTVGWHRGVGAGGGSVAYGGRPSMFGSRD